MTRVFRTALIGRRQVAADTLEVSFQRPDDFEFRAGQYTQVRVPKLLHSDSRGKSRVFSIVSSPLDEDTISVAFRQTGSGFKRTLEDMELGSPVLVEGPHGFYVLPERLSRPLTLVAGGIGITPIMSMLRYACQSEYDPGDVVTLIYGNRSKTSAAYLDELEDIARRRGYLRLKKRFGLMDEEYLEKVVRGTDSCVWYVTGPPGMVDSVRSALHVLGVDSDQVFSEGFVGY
jgi:ferredoxin-NADP reductase